ncbi:MAG: isocitrate/isopropylmalate family dehydrogenase, partial [Nitrospirota bacterium]
MKIAVFPFGNLSEDMEAPRAVMPAVKDRLAEMGMILADEADVDRILFRDRQRDTSYVSADVAREFGDELGVKAVFVGCVVSYTEEDSPQIGLTARLIDTRTGRILWAGFNSAKGTEFAGLLRLGEIKTMDRLIPEVVDRLLGSLSPGPPPVHREQTYKIAVMPGDGTGPEVTAEAVKILKTAAEKFDFKVDLTEFDFGGERYKRTGETLPDSGVEELRKFDAILLGAIGHPDVAPGILEKGILLKARFELDQYINLRPVRLYPGVETPIKDKGPDEVDFVVVRENTGDAYTGTGGFTMRGTPHEVAVQSAVYSRFQ